MSHPRRVVLVMYEEDTVPTAHGPYRADIADEQAGRLRAFLKRNGEYAPAHGMGYRVWTVPIAPGPIRVRDYSG